MKYKQCRSLRVKVGGVESDIDQQATIWLEASRTHNRQHSNTGENQPQILKQEDAPWTHYLSEAMWT